MQGDGLAMKQGEWRVAILLVDDLNDALRAKAGPIEHNRRTTAHRPIFFPRLQLMLISSAHEASTGQYTDQGAQQLSGFDLNYHTSQNTSHRQLNFLNAPILFTA